jgi:hypothetical protein
MARLRDRFVLRYTVVSDRVRRTTDLDTRSGPQAGHRRVQGRGVQGRQPRYPPARSPGRPDPAAAPQALLRGAGGIEGLSHRCPPSGLHRWSGSGRRCDRVPARPERGRLRACSPRSTVARKLWSLHVARERGEQSALPLPRERRTPGRECFPRGGEHSDRECSPSRGCERVLGRASHARNGRGAVARADTPASRHERAGFGSAAMTARNHLPSVRHTGRLADLGRAGSCEA